MMSRLKEKYRNEAVPALMEKFNYKNIMMVPKVDKITVNMGVGAAVDDAKAMDAAVKDLSLITGQKPIITRAKKSVAAFKVREGMPVGCMVTLRGDRMYDFLDKLINATLPRVRDFRGLSPRSFDGRGNYTLGIREQIIFPEISYDDVERVQGMNIVIRTTAETDEEGLEMLRSLGMPFREQ
ncbi:MAG: 50S ribosomal protein L5 [Firmicutes bacterium]|nr:50S ribosomal protein L5 [Bacillota bacterium]